MRKAWLCIFAITVVAVAQIGKSGRGGTQQTIDVPTPIQLGSRLSHSGGAFVPSLGYDCGNSNRVTREILGMLLDETSADAELKYETTNGLDDDQIYHRRMGLIKELISKMKKSD